MFAVVVDIAHVDKAVEIVAINGNLPAEIFGTVEINRESKVMEIRSNS